MDKEKYFEFNGSARGFHKKRKLFFIKDKVIFAPENADYSHAEWFEKIGLIKNNNEDEVMNSIVRGYIDSTGIYFYKGWTFFVDEEAEKIFFSHLKEIPISSSDLEIFGGLIINVPGKGEPIKKFGKVSKYLKNRNLANKINA